MLMPVAPEAFSIAVEMMSLASVFIKSSMSVSYMDRVRIRGFLIIHCDKAGSLIGMKELALPAAQMDELYLPR